MPRGQPLGKYFRAHPLVFSVTILGVFTFSLSTGAIRYGDLLPLTLAVGLATPNPLRKALPASIGADKHDRLWALLGVIVAGCWYSNYR